MNDSPEKARFVKRLESLWRAYLNAVEKAFSWDRLDDENRSRLIEQCPALYSEACKLRDQVYRLRDEEKIDDDELWVYAGNIGSVFWLIGDIYLDRKMYWSAEAHLRQALLLCDNNAHMLESLLRCLLAAGRPLDAAKAVNGANPALIRMEQDSTARKITNWAGENDAFASALDANVLELCVELIAKYPTDSAEPGTD